MIGYIYKITNKINGKIYIGSAIDMDQREHSHCSDLRCHRHHNSHLQNAFNKYGEDAFEFSSKKVDVENETALRLLEERYINYCWNSGKLYNLSKKGKGGDLISYHPKNKEIRKKISEASKRMYASMSEEQKRLRSENTKGEKNPNYGNKWTEEQRKKLSDFRKEYSKTHIHPQKGKTFEMQFGEEYAVKLKKELSEQAKLRMGDKNPFYGRHHSEETKQKIREKHLGKPNLDSAKQVIINGIIYESASACAKELNIPMATIAYRARNGIYGFAYVGETEDKQREACHNWTIKECEELAKECETLKEFGEKYIGALSFMRKQSNFKEFKEKYFKELRHRWSKDEILDLCKTADSYTDLRKKYPKLEPVFGKRKDLREIAKQFYFL